MYFSPFVSEVFVMLDTPGFFVLEPRCLSRHFPDVSNTQRAVTIDLVGLLHLAW